MKTVYKYPIPTQAKTFELQLPIGFKFLRVAFQGAQLMFWAEVDKDGPKDIFRFEQFGTGQDIAAGMKYLTTYDNGPFVFHIYQK